MRCPWWLMIDDSIEMSHVKTLKSDFECTPHISQAANNFPWSAQLAFAAFKIQYPYVITFMTWNHDFTLLCSEVWTLIHRSRRTQFIFVMSVPWSGALKETAVFYRRVCKLLGNIQHKRRAAGWELILVVSLQNRQRCTINSVPGLDDERNKKKKNMYKSVITISDPACTVV